MQTVTVVPKFLSLVLVPWLRSAVLDCRFAPQSEGCWLAGCAAVSFLGEFLWLYLRCDGPVGREDEVDRRAMG
jgi:hypothetical protein